MARRTHRVARPAAGVGTCLAGGPITMSDPFNAWQKARQAQATLGTTRDGLAVQIKALQEILSDVEEHEDNIDLYGDGEYSQGEYSRFLKQAQQALVGLDRGLRVPLAAAPDSATRIELSAPTLFPGGGGAWPVVSGTSFVSTDDELACLRAIASGAVTTRFDVKNADLRSVAVSPDGAVVVLGLWSHRWVACDARTGQVLFDNDEQNDWVTALTFSPDGHILYSGGGEKLLAHAMPGGAVVAALGEADSLDTIGVLAVSEAGDTLLHTQNKPGDNFLVTRQARTLALHTEMELYVSDCAFTAGRLVALSGNAITIVDVKNQDVLARAELLNRQTRWCAGESLAICQEHQLAALILREAAEANQPTFELQVWRIFPLERIAALPLPDFMISGQTARGGLVFAQGRIVIVGEASNLSIEYVVS